MKEVFQRLEKAGIHLKASKCFIGMDKIDFLGFVDSGEGIYPQNSKVQVINYLEAIGVRFGLEKFKPYW